MSNFIEDKSKLCVVHSGIDIAKFQHPKSNKLRTEFGIADHEIIIGIVAALAPHKDYPTFVTTARLILNAGIKAKFVAIGEGPSRKEVENAIEASDMSEHIILTGFRSDVATLLPQFDLFLITSKTEGLGTSILDALASRVPVVATAAGGITEIIEDRVNGRLCLVGDAEALCNAVKEMLADEKGRIQMIENGLLTIQQFSKANTAKNTLDIYTEVLSVS